jgi:hypothetical protein
MLIEAIYNDLHSGLYPHHHERLRIPDRAQAR